MNMFYIAIFSILFIVSLYFGYKDDFNRDKNGFKTILVSVIGSLVIIIFCLYKLETVIEISIKQNLKEYYMEEFGWNKNLENSDSNGIKSELNTEEIISQSNILTKKIDNGLSIFNFLYFFLISLTVTQFNKLVKKYFAITKS